jgi:hypothetical protein
MTKRQPTCCQLPLCLCLKSRSPAKERKDQDMPRGYSRSNASDQIIPADDLAIVFADFSARRVSPLLNSYFTGAACLLATPRET